MADRFFPPNFIGTNIQFTEFLAAGFSMYGDKVVTTCTASQTSGTSVQSTITVANATGITAGQFVTGVNIAPINTDGEPAVVLSVSETTVTINTNIRKNITNLNVYFHNNQNSLEYLLQNAAGSGCESLRTSFFWSDYEKTAPVGNTHTYTWKISDGANQDIEYYFQLASQNGLRVMPRAGGPPDWAKDWDYAADETSPFSFQNPASNAVLKNKGIRVTATGTSGNSYALVADAGRGFLIVPGMVITESGVSGSGFDSGTIVKSVDLSGTNCKITFNKPLIANLSGSYNMTATIANYEANGNANKKMNGSDVFIFDTLADANIFLINLRRRGGSIPRNYNDFASFMNAMVNRFGSNGTAWEEFGNTVTTTTTSSSTPVSPTVPYTQTIPISITTSNANNIVVGMTIESNANGSVPSTAKDGNNAYIAPDTVVCSINGNTLTLSKPLNATMPSGTTVKLKFPRIVNWQIWNEMDLYNSHFSDFKYQIVGSSKSTLVSGPLKGNNWPQHPDKMNNLSGTTITLKDYTYGWAPTFSTFIQKVKKEMRSVDSKSKLVLGAITQGTSGYNVLFNTSGGKYGFDKFAVNQYVAPSTLITYNLNTLRPFFESKYGKSTLNYPTLPNLIISEYGWSTDLLGYGSNAVTETEQSDNIDALMSSSTSGNTFQDFIQNNYNWTIESAMYFKWSSNETGYVIKHGSENERGIYKYKNPSIKTGTVTGTSGTKNLVFTAAIPNSWIVGASLRYRDESSDNALDGIPGPDSSAGGSTPTITNINTSTKTVTISSNLTKNVNATLSLGSTTSGSGETYIYISNKLETSIKITGLSIPSSGKVYFTTETDHLLTKGNSVLVRNITGTNAAKFNGLFTVTGSVNSKTFSVSTDTSTGSSGLLFTNAHILVSVQPKIAAKTYMSQALYFQGR